MSDELWAIYSKNGEILVAASETMRKAWTYFYVIRRAKWPNETALMEFIDHRSLAGYSCHKVTVKKVEE